MHKGVKVDREGVYLVLLLTVKFKAGCGVPHLQAQHVVGGGRSSNPASAT